MTSATLAPPRTSLVRTLGCQMNVHDSDPNWVIRLGASWPARWVAMTRSLVQGAPTGDTARVPAHSARTVDEVQVSGRAVCR